MSYTVKEAAESAGKSKTAILRAIQAGRVSAQRDDLGQWRIDPAELHRVYPVVESGDEDGAGIGADETPHEVEVRLLRELLAERERQVSSLTTMNEGLENVISDLMARLDQEATDRRRAYAQLTGLLTDQRVPTEKVRASVPNWRRWWPW